MVMLIFLNIRVFFKYYICHRIECSFSTYKNIEELNVCKVTNFSVLPFITITSIKMLG